MASEARIGIRSDSKQAETSISSVRGMLQKLGQDAKGSILAGVGIGAGVSAFNVLSGAVRGTVDALGGMVQAAIDDETSVRRLTAALYANVPGWDGNIDAIERTILASQRLGFTDDETRASLTFLSAATNDVAKAQELHATAMDLARFKGISLQAASEALVKVESGRYRLLAGLGIQLRQGATATEALAAVQAVAAGQAEEWGESTAGALQSAQIAIEEAGEEIGRQLLPVVKELAEFARDVLVPALTAAFDALQQVPWGEITDGIGAIVNAFNPASAALEHFSSEAEQLAAISEASGRTTANSWTAMGAAILAAAEESAPAVTEEWAGAADDVEAIAALLPSQVANAMIAGQRDVESGVALLTGLMNDEWTDASREAYYAGILSGQNLAEGLASEDADVRSQAILVRDNALRELRLLRSGAYDAGANAGNSLGTGLTSATSAVGAAARGLASSARGPIAGVDGYTAGKNVGYSYGNGLAAAYAYVFSKAAQLANAARHHLQFAGSPAYTESRKIGEMVAKTYGEGLSRGLGDLPKLGGVLPGGVRETAATTVPMMASGGSPNIIQLVVDGRVLAEVVDRNLYYMTPTYGTLPRN